MSEEQKLPVSVDPRSNALAARGLQYGGFNDDDDEKRSGPGLKRYVNAVLRYKWLVLPLVVLGTAGAVYASQHVRMKYVAQARLWIERGQAMMGGPGPIQSSQLLTDRMVQTLVSDTHSYIL
jgi:uncharacterized protein involved in exopolysaccharide biosynthesis